MSAIHLVRHGQASFGADDYDLLSALGERQSRVLGQALAGIGPRIVHGHVENMAAGVHAHLLPTEGDMEMPLYIAALERAGFTGGLALDLYSQDYEAVAPREIAYLRSLMTCV